MATSSSGFFLQEEKNKNRATEKISGFKGKIFKTGKAFPNSKIGNIMDYEARLIRLKSVESILKMGLFLKLR